MGLIWVKRLLGRAQQSSGGYGRAVQLSPTVFYINYELREPGIHRNIADIYISALVGVCYIIFYLAQEATEQVQLFIHQQHGNLWQN